jgi:hypothetical protein
VREVIADATGEVAAVMQHAVGGGQVKVRERRGLKSSGSLGESNVSTAEAGTYLSKVGVAGLVVGDGAGSKVAAGGLLVSCNHRWSV